MSFALPPTSTAPRPHLKAILLASALLLSSLAAAGYGTSERLVPVIVREWPGAGTAPEEAVEQLGGEVGTHLNIIDGFAARVPQASVGHLRSMPVVHSVTLDRPIKMLSDETAPSPSVVRTTMSDVARAIGAPTLWRKGYRGQGIDVAVIDTGVVPVDGLTVPGKVINGADVSFDSQSEELRYMDSYGHGTHLAGIIAGRDDAAVMADGSYGDSFAGIAPDARIVNVKAADTEGATDISQVIAAIDWVVEHRTDAGMNIRVLNLSFGTDGVQTYLTDPLTYAVEVAWRKGLVVSVAAGNSQYGDAKLNNPAYDPYVLAVGASDLMGTPEVADDTVPEWSARGDFLRRPDLVAPGRSIVSLRAPGSYLDEAYPLARDGERFVRGSGTSQSAAVVSGAAALLLSHRPSLTPDKVKALLKKTAVSLPSADRAGQGAGMIDVAAASMTSPPWLSTQLHLPATGLGSLDAARGTTRLVDDTGEILLGEQNIFGQDWTAGLWARTSLLGGSWVGGVFNGLAWTDDGWTGKSWGGKSWGGKSWGGKSWGGKSWGGKSWGGKSWGGKSWGGESWTGKSWGGKSWGAHAWSSAGWTE